MKYFAKTFFKMKFFCYGWDESNHILQKSSDKKGLTEGPAYELSCIITFSEAVSVDVRLHRSTIKLSVS